MSKYQTACAKFTFFNDGVSKGKFIDFCNGEKGLNVTRGWDGCHSVECYERDDNSVTIWQKWESKEHHQSYVKYRKEQGDFDFLNTLISDKPDIFYLDPVDFTDGGK
jgi:quinol monooxygenase YgiN